MDASGRAPKPAPLGMCPVPPSTNFKKHEHISTHVSGIPSSQFLLKMPVIQIKTTREILWVGQHALNPRSKYAHHLRRDGQACRAKADARCWAQRRKKKKTTPHKKMEMGVPRRCRGYPVAGKPGGKPAFWICVAGPPKEKTRRNIDFPGC